MSDQDKIKADERNATEKDTSGAADRATDNVVDSKVSRRRALIAGLAAAPVVLSLMNRSAWGQPAAETSCTLVASYVNAGNRWQSPRPANNNGQLEITDADRARCNL